MARAAAVASAGWRLVVAVSRPSILNRAISFPQVIGRSYHLPVHHRRHVGLDSRFVFPAGSLSRGYAGARRGHAQGEDDDDEEMVDGSTGIDEEIVNGSTGIDDGYEGFEYRRAGSDDDEYYGPYGKLSSDSE